MKLVFIIFFWGAALPVFSQVTVFPADKIYLNDSVTVYEGLIVEQAPAKYVRIVRKPRGDTLQVWMNEIWKMVRVYPVADTVRIIPQVKQKIRHNKFVFMELLGSGGLYSFNFDFRCNKQIVNKWGLRTGAAYLPLNTVNYSGDVQRFHTFLIPFLVNYLCGKKNGFLELGLGAVYVFKKPQGVLQANEYEYFIKNINRRIPNVYGAFSVGYRRHPVKGGIMWGVSVSPIIGNSFLIPSIGIKIGYSLI